MSDKTKKWIKAAGVRAIKTMAQTAVATIGTAAVRTIVVVDFTKPTSNTDEYQATARDFSVIPDSEGGSMDAYTYSGNFKVKGSKIEGTATSTDDWLTLTFVEA